MPAPDQHPPPRPDAPEVASSLAWPTVVFRLAHLGWHIAHGVFVVHRVFPGLPAAQRHERVGRWARALLATLRIDVRTHGELPAQCALIVSNHVSWLDILVIHSVCPHARFVSKDDVRRWPLIGGLVEGAGTLLVRRDRRSDAAKVLDAMAQALAQGDTVAFFPEGTTSNGEAVLAFHASLLQSAVAAQVPVQPLALRYSQHGHALSPDVPYIGDTSFVQSLWQVCRARGVVAQVRLLTPRSAPHADRKVLAAELRQHIANALTTP